MANVSGFPPHFNSTNELMTYINSKGGEKNVYDLIRYKPSTGTVELRMFGTIPNTEGIIEYINESAKVLKLGVREKWKYYLIY